MSLPYLGGLSIKRNSVFRFLCLGFRLNPFSLVVWSNPSSILAALHRPQTFLSQSLTLTHSLSLTHSHSLTVTHSLSLTHSQSLSLSLSLTHSHSIYYTLEHMITSQTVCNYIIFSYIGLQNQIFFLPKPLDFLFFQREESYKKL